MPIKVLLDTDIGSDIDDAVCLAYLLAQPECELLGITTVTGQAAKRAQLASALCRVAGQSIPIYPGAEEPLLVSQKQPEAPQAAALARWPHEQTFPAGQAVEFLRRTIRAHPGEVVLLTIGPLTNIGLLFALDREIPRLLKGLVMMCGVFTSGPPQAERPARLALRRRIPQRLKRLIKRLMPGVFTSGSPQAEQLAQQEWNAMLDPHATAIVYQSPVALHRSVGLDVTMQVRLPAATVRERFQAPLLRPVLDFAEVFFRGVDTLTFHDPLAATMIFDPAICRLERGTVAVELSDPARLGQTRWTPGGPEAPHEVAFGVDAERFFEHYFAVLNESRPVESASVR